LDAKRRAELSLRVGAILPWILVGNTVWRIKRRPVWTGWRQRRRLVFRWKPGTAPRRPPAIGYRGPAAR